MRWLDAYGFPDADAITATSDTLLPGGLLLATEFLASVELCALVATVANVEVAIAYQSDPAVETAFIALPQTTLTEVSTTRTPRQSQWTPVAIPRGTLVTFRLVAHRISTGSNGIVRHAQILLRRVGAP